MINEFRAVREQLDSAKTVRASILASQLPQDVAEAYFGPHFAGTIISMPHALDSDFFHTAQDPGGRAVDIGFRGEAYTPYVGHNDRQTITSYFIEQAERLGLRIDIRFSPAANDNEWRGFLERCRSVLGHEAGADYLDIDDTIRNVINSLCTKFEANDLIDFTRFLVERNREPLLSGRIVAPRHFEAIGMKTCQILFPGRYNDILKADFHYIALQRDFSNIEDVLMKLRDDGFVNNQVESTFEWALESQTHAHRIDWLLKTIESVPASS